MVDHFLLHTIGDVHSPVDEPVDENWGEIVSRIIIRPDYRPGLLGLQEFSHIIVITYLHRARFELLHHLQRRPRSMPSMPLLGIFAQRAKDRPNPLGITAVELISVEPDGLTVRGLDAIDGTPVLDIKPYFPQYDRVENARVPAWTDELMKGYF